MLTSHTKERIIELRRRGLTFGQIAEEVGGSRNTVKSLCRRLGIEPETKTPAASNNRCEQCDNTFDVKAGKRFCSTECRLKWWHTNPQRLNKKAIYTFTCRHCDRTFEAYGNKGRKFCAHACYIRHRFGTKGGRS